MRMKKILCVIAILLLSLVLCLCFTACEEEHVHSFSAWTTTTLPTCTTEGRQTRTCSSCNASEDVPIPALGHKKVIDNAVAATCLAEGKTEGSHCSVCNIVIKPQNTIAALGHTAVTDAAVAPTCTAQGKTEGSHCSACNATLVEQTAIEPLGHQYDAGVVVTSASCVAAGTKKYTCTVPTCRHTYNEPYEMATFTATEIYDKAIKFVAEITIYDKTGEEIGVGAGFVYSSDGRIVTNYHVIEDAYSATVTVNKKTYAVQSVLTFDADIDLAVLKINATGLTVANVCKNPVKAGQTVWAIGSPRGQTNTLSQGIITYAERELYGVCYVQHDASIAGGNSGGPLINVYGEVIGINTFYFADSQNLNFAVFADELDNLYYGTPISLADLYDLNHDPYNILTNWLTENYTDYSAEEIRYDEIMEGAWLSIAMYLETGGFYMEALWELEDGAELYIFLDLSSDPSRYVYSAYLSYNGYENIAKGYINAATFNENTTLTPITYEGDYWDEELVLELYHVGLIDLLYWFDWVSFENGIGVTPADFGFAALEWV